MSLYKIRDIIQSVSKRREPQVCIRARPNPASVAIAEQACRQTYINTHHANVKTCKHCLGRGFIGYDRDGYLKPCACIINYRSELEATYKRIAEEYNSQQAADAAKGDGE